MSFHLWSAEFEFVDLEILWGMWKSEVFDFIMQAE